MAVRARPDAARPGCGDGEHQSPGSLTAVDTDAGVGTLRTMKNKALATKRDLGTLETKMKRGFEQLVVTSAAALRLTQKEIRALRARVKQLERKARRGR